jgi:hypothetical protein
MVVQQRDTQRQHQPAFEFLNPGRKVGARRTGLPVRQQLLVLAGGVGT